MYKTHEILMLPTNNSSHIYLTTKTNKLGLVSGNNPEDLEQFPQIVIETQNQHLYLLSSETPQLNDWVTDGERIAQINVLTIDDPNKHLYKKIIATTDTELRDKITKSQFHEFGNSLPQFPTSLIELFVKKYNEGNPLKSIDIEYDSYHGINSSIAEISAISGNDDYNWKGRGDLRDYELKLNQNNEFFYKPLKESWTRKEVVELLWQWDEIAENNGRASIGGGEEFKLANWIAQNL